MISILTLMVMSAHEVSGEAGKPRYDEFEDLLRNASAGRVNGGKWCQKYN